MCIAIVKPRGVSLAEDRLRLCFSNNPDGAGFAIAKNGLYHRSQDYHATVWPSPALDSHTLQCACLGARPLHAGKFADFLGGEQHHFFFRGVRVVISSSAAQLGSHRSGSVAGFSV